MGEFTSVVLKLTAEPNYVASLPVSMKVTGVPEDFSVDQSAMSAILKTGGSVSFMLQVFTPVTIATGSVSPPQLESPVPRIDVEFSFIGTTTSYSIYVVQTNN